MCGSFIEYFTVYYESVGTYVAIVIKYSSYGPTSTNESFPYLHCTVSLRFMCVIQCGHGLATQVSKQESIHLALCCRTPLLNCRWNANTSEHTHFWNCGTGRPDDGICGIEGATKTVLWRVCMKAFASHHSVDQKRNGPVSDLHRWLIIIIIMYL